MKLLTIDTETTGLSPRLHKVLSIGLLIVDVNKSNLKILGQDHLLIRHKSYNADPKALAVNKIDLKEHDRIAIDAENACEKLNTFVRKNSLQKTPLLGHNIAFDKEFLSSLFEDQKMPCFLHEECLDTMHFWNYLKKRNLVPSYLRSNLKTIANFFKVDYSNAHSAIADCYITAKIYQKMLAFSN